MLVLIGLMIAALATANDSICRRHRGQLIYAVTGGTCKRCLCSNSGGTYCSGESECRVCRQTRTMGCKEGCPSGHEWRHVSSHSWGCCASFTSCGGHRRVCERNFPCDGPYGRRGRRRSDDEAEEIEEIPIEEAEGFEFAYLLDDSEYDEEKLKQMTQEELNDFIEELASHPHKSYPAEFESSSSPSEDLADRRLESMTESRLKSLLEKTMEN